MINEEIIIRQMKEGNQLAFTLLFNEYSKQVYSLAFNTYITGNLQRMSSKMSFSKSGKRKKT